MSGNTHDKDLPSICGTSVDSVPRRNTINENDDYSNVLKDKDDMNQEVEVQTIIDKLYQNFFSNNFGDYKIPESYLNAPIVDSEKIVNEYINAYKNDTLLVDSEKIVNEYINIYKNDTLFVDSEKNVNEYINVDKNYTLLVDSEKIVNEYINVDKNDTILLDSDNSDKGIIQVSKTNDSCYKPQEEVKKATSTNTIAEDVNENMEDSISDEIVRTSLSELMECPFKFKIINQINKSYLNRLISHYNPLLVNENRINSKRKKDPDSDNDSSKPPKKIKLFSPPKLKGNGKDIFCFKCHKPEGNLKVCDFCPRVFHLGKCSEGDKMVEGIRMCVECDQINSAEPFEKGVQYLSWCLMAILKRIRTYDQSIPFREPVDIKLYPDYRDYIVKPMCLSDIQKNILSGFYISLYSFLADFKWIIHNSYIFNSASSKLTIFARTMLHIATKECKEIALCSQCYFNACSEQLTDSFIEPCDEPHMIVWAKLQGHPFWPAKLIAATDMGVHVKFFGDHNKAFVPVKSCFLFSEEMPTRSKFVCGLEAAIIEARKHITKLIEKSINFCYAAPKTVLDLDHLEYQKNIMFPKNPRVNLQSKQSYYHVENKNDHMKNLSETFKTPIINPTPAPLIINDKLNLKAKEMPYVKQYGTYSSAVRSVNNHNVHLKSPKITKTNKQNKNSDNVDSISQEVFHKYIPLSHSKQAQEENHAITSCTENTSAQVGTLFKKPLTNVSYCHIDQVKAKTIPTSMNKPVSSKTKMNKINNNHSNIITSTEDISTEQHAQKEVISIVDSPVYFIEPHNKSEEIKATQLNLAGGSSNLACGSSGNVTLKNNLTESLPKLNLKAKNMPHVKQYGTYSPAVRSVNNHNVYLKPPIITKTNIKNKSSDNVYSVSPEVFHKCIPPSSSKQALKEENHAVTSCTENTSAQVDTLIKRPLTNVSYCRFDLIKTPTSINKPVSSKTKMNKINNNHSNIITSTEDISTEQHAQKEVISVVDSPVYFIEPHNKSEEIKAIPGNHAKAIPGNHACGSSGNVTSKNYLTESLSKLNLKAKKMPHVKQNVTYSPAVRSVNNHNVYLKPPIITKTNIQNKSSDNVDSVSPKVFHKCIPPSSSKQAQEENHAITSCTENTSAQVGTLIKKPLTNVSYCHIDQVKAKKIPTSMNKPVSSKTKMNKINNNHSNIITSTEDISTEQHAQKEVISIVDSPVYFIEPHNKSEKIKATQLNLAGGSSNPAGGTSNPAGGSSRNVTSKNYLTEPVSTDNIEQDPLLFKNIKNYLISNFKFLQNTSVPYDNLIKSLFSFCDKVEKDCLQDGDIPVLGAEIFKFMDDFYEKTKESVKLKEERTVMHFKDTVIKAYNESFKAAKEGTWCKVCKKEATFYCCQGNFYCTEECQNKDWTQHQKVCKQMDMKVNDKYFRFNPEYRKFLLDFQRGGPLPPGYLQLIRWEKSVQNQTHVTGPSTKQKVSSRQSHKTHNISKLVSEPIPEKKIADHNRPNCSNFEHSTEVIYMQSDDPGPSFL